MSYFISEQFIEANVVRTIAVQLENIGRDMTTEYLLSVIVALIDGLDSTIVEQCRDPSIGLQRILEEYLTAPELETDRFIEEKQYCQEILRQVFEDCPQVEVVYDEGADR